MVYERRGEAFVSEELTRIREEPLPWNRQVIVVEAGIEHRYVYFYAKEPSTAGAVPVLAKYVRATPGVQQVTSFPVFVDAGDESRQVREHVIYDSSDPLPDRIRAKAIQTSEIRDSVEPGLLVQTEVIRDLGSEHDDDEDVIRREFDTSRYPASFVDYLGPWMEIDDTPRD